MKNYFQKVMQSFLKHFIVCVCGSLSIVFATEFVKRNEKLNF